MGSLTIVWKGKSILCLCIFKARSCFSEQLIRRAPGKSLCHFNCQPTTTFSCSQDKCLCQVRQNKTLSSPQNNLTEFQKNVPETEKCLRQGCEQAFLIQQREECLCDNLFCKSNALKGFRVSGFMSDEDKDGKTTTTLRGEDGLRDNCQSTAGGDFVATTR